MVFNVGLNMSLIVSPNLSHNVNFNVSLNVGLALKTTEYTYNCTTLFDSIFLDRSDIIKQGFGKRKHIITQHLLISLRFGLLPLASSSLKFRLIVQILGHLPR